MGANRSPFAHRLCVAALLALQLISSVVFSKPPADASIVNDTVVARIDDGDFLHPSFSPDGKRLAYARVWVEERTELTELYVRDLVSGATWRLLDADSSRKYAVYNAFVYQLRWISNDRLTAFVSDGDVGSTRVEFDVTAQRIVNERNDEDDEATWYAQIEQRMRSVARLPDWKPAVVRNAFENSVALPDGSFLIQPQYAGVPPDVYHITTSGRLTRLTQLEQEAFNSLCGAVQLDDSLLFLLAESRTGNSKKADLLLFRDGRTDKLDTLTTLTEPRLEALHSSSERVLFFVSIGNAYQRSPGVLYEYSPSGLRNWPTTSTLHDATVDADGQLVALVIWENDRRVIEVRKLDERRRRD